MQRKEIDQLYHLLRVTSNLSGEHTIDTKCSLTPQEKIDVIYGLCRHLLAGGDYMALIKFSQLYGESFLIDPTFNAIKKVGWQFGRIVDFGAGLGWLGRGLSAKFGMTPVLFVDKRPWPLINLVADLETPEGREKVLNEMREDDMIVACDFLHCLDDPEEVMSDFSEWPTVILEYCPSNPEYLDSYSAQIERYGASPILKLYLSTTFSGRVMAAFSVDPYTLTLVEPL